MKLGMKESHKKEYKTMNVKWLLIPAAAALLFKDQLAEYFTGHAQPAAAPEGETAGPRGRRRRKPPRSIPPARKGGLLQAAQNDA